MGGIVNATLITNNDPRVFGTQVMELIYRLQELGQEVEIQYSTSQNGVHGINYSALVIERTLET